MAQRRYLNESHRRYCEACQKSNEEMSKQPWSREQMKAQCDRVKQASKGAARGQKIEHIYQNEAHRKSSLAAQKEVAEMSKHPLSAEQMMEQCLRNARTSKLRDTSESE